jgi:hypothetical protein
MLIFAIAFFIIAALLGLVVLTALLQDKPTPRPVVFMHGIIAGMALLMLTTYVVLGNKSPLLITSLGLFILAALGGLTMFTLNTSGKRVPKILALGHPALALTSLVLLIVYVVQSVS